jgi:lipopolysaccharide transport system permease protein
MQAKLPTLGKEYAYSVYLCAGLLTWNYFVEAVNRGQNIFLENANLLKKVNFPVLTLSVIAMANAMVSFGIIFGLFLIFLVATGSFPGLVFVAIFPVLLIQTLLAFGLGLTLGILNVFFRDVGQLFGVVLQFWFWLTPIVYPASILPEWAQQLIAYNPMTSIATAYQTILVNAQMPDWRSLWPVTLLAITLCVLGLRIYHKHASEMVDEL